MPLLAEMIGTDISKMVLSLAVVGTDYFFLN